MTLTPEQIYSGMKKPKRPPPVLEDIKAKYEMKHGKPKIKPAQRVVSEAYRHNYDSIRWCGNG